MRNSVKAVVDAYDGTVTFYVDRRRRPDRSRPTSEAFPDLFTDVDDVPEELRDHLRYPEDLFRVQTNMWGRYHIDDPDDFYEQTDAWAVAQDPGTRRRPPRPRQTTDAARAASRRAASGRIDPYYLLMRLPGEEQEELPHPPAVRAGLGATTAARS